MINVVIKLNNMSNIIVKMSNLQLKQFKAEVELNTWIALNKYTDDLKDETDINVNNISVIVYQSIQE